MITAAERSAPQASDCGFEPHPRYESLFILYLRIAGGQAVGRSLVEGALPAVKGIKNSKKWLRPKKAVQP
jgi:hypothetical protein